MASTCFPYPQSSLTIPETQGTYVVMPHITYGTFDNCYSLNSCKTDIKLEVVAVDITMNNVVTALELIGKTNTTQIIAKIRIVI